MRGGSGGGWFSLGGSSGGEVKTENVEPNPEVLEDILVLGGIGGGVSGGGVSGPAVTEQSVEELV